MNINPTNISDEEKTRIFNESMKKQKPYVEKEPVRIGRVNQWISVEDRLPDAYKDIIFFAHNKFVVCGKYYGLRHSHQTWESGVVEYWDNEVTHWMPLPEPPKNGGEVDA